MRTQRPDESRSASAAMSSRHYAGGELGPKCQWHFAARRTTAQGEGEAGKAPVTLCPDERKDYGRSFLALQAAQERIARQVRAGAREVRRACAIDGYACFNEAPAISRG